MITIEKVDYVMNVTGAEYQVVKNALLDADGDVEKAVEIIRASVNNYEYDEKEKDEFFKFEDIRFEDIKKAIKDIWNTTNATKILVEKDGETVINISLTAASLGAILAPIATFIGMGSGLIADYDFKIVTADKEEINIKEYILNMKNK